MWSIIAFLFSSTIYPRNGNDCSEKRIIHERYSNSNPFPTSRLVNTNFLKLRHYNSFVTQPPSVNIFYFYRKSDAKHLCRFVFIPFLFSKMSILLMEQREGLGTPPQPRIQFSTYVFIPLCLILPHAFNPVSVSPFFVVIPTFYSCGFFNLFTPLPSPLITQF